MGCREIRGRVCWDLHTHTHHTPHAPRYPSGDKNPPRCAPGNSALTGLEPGRAARPLPPLASGPLVRSLHPHLPKACATRTEKLHKKQQEQKFATTSRLRTICVRKGAFYDFLFFSCSIYASLSALSTSELCPAQTDCFSIINGHT